MSPEIKGIARKVTSILADNSDSPPPSKIGERANTTSFGPELGKYRPQLDDKWGHISVEPFLEMLTNLSGFYKNPTLLDFGTGDCRVPLVSETAGFTKTYGVEISKGIIPRSNRIISNLENICAIETGEIISDNNYLLRKGNTSLYISEEADCFNQDLYNKIFDLNLSEVSIFYLFPGYGMLQKAIDFYIENAGENSIILARDSGEFNNDFNLKGLNCMSLNNGKFYAIGKSDVLKCLNTYIKNNYQQTPTIS